jgi:phosphatidylserine/phosphatidylglycerophosphate/cardiolipin synthase-like enzyme
MSTKFFTNEKENTLLRRFAGVFEHIPNIEYFDALVGYFRASGYFAIRPYLNKVPKIRILVGINVDKIVVKYHSQGLLFKGDHQLALEDLNSSIKDDIQNSEYSKEVEDGIKQFLEDVVTGKVQIKAHPHRKLHAKIYIFKPDNFNEYTTGEVITGSSNLTDAGLGGKDTSNYEFNVALRDYSDVKFASDEFEKLWAEGVNVLPVDFEKINRGVKLST